MLSVATCLFASCGGPNLNDVLDSIPGGGDISNLLPGGGTETPTKGLSYTPITDGYAVSGIGSCEQTEIVIPSTHQGSPVKAINDSAFEGCTKITSIKIPDSVKTIGSAAFSECTGLTSVTIGNSVKTIDDWAFDGCTNLTVINYRGTKAQWKAINKSSVWDSNTGNYTINYEYMG